MWKLKFAPDWDSAADELNKAAVCFRVGQSWAQAKAAHLRAAEAFANNGNLYHAGKQLDQAMNIVRDLGQLEEVEQLASWGAGLYRQAGSRAAADRVCKIFRGKSHMSLKPKARRVHEFFRTEI